ncbi:SMI1/KNR4 family protein [Alkalimonas sp. MEB108]|uniref:SMI1/KNR4 family protein n=1 Tax=Alkalimonas cellulosilytica TaxID=3058395 RepID=A0ABU7J766_9GAMM|nr:SMI1/KNR4 family protein [Alkalimonas sp. MEB108]MEE2002133.1 SMI1/KNR4 family protein [Alkalimonas sp. MEB108]
MNYTTFKNLQLEEYLYEDLPSEADINAAEAILKVSFPFTYRQLLLVGAGWSPMNLRVRLKSGYQPGFRCFNHVFLDSDAGHKVNVSELEAWGYGDRLLQFADNGGGVRYCLDYRFKPDDPPVVLVFPSEEDGSEDAVTKIADHFDDFLAKYTVPLNKA